MFIAMNRFQVKLGAEQALEPSVPPASPISARCRASSNSTCSRGRLPTITRCIPCHLGRQGRVRGLDEVEEFRRAHARADNKTGESLYLGHPKLRALR